MDQGQLIQNRLISRFFVVLHFLYVLVFSAVYARMFALATTQTEVR